MEENKNLSINLDELVEEDFNVSGLSIDLDKLENMDKSIDKINLSLDDLQEEEIVNSVKPILNLDNLEDEDKTTLNIDNLVNEDDEGLNIDLNKLQDESLNTVLSTEGGIDQFLDNLLEDIEYEDAGKTEEELILEAANRVLEVFLTTKAGIQALAVKNNKKQYEVDRAVNMRENEVSRVITKLSSAYGKDFQFALKDFVYSLCKKGTNKVLEEVLETNLVGKLGKYHIERFDEDIITCADLNEQILTNNLRFNRERYEKADRLRTRYGFLWNKFVTSKDTYDSVQDSLAISAMQTYGDKYIDMNHYKPYKELYLSDFISDHEIKILVNYFVESYNTDVLNEFDDAVIRRNQRTLELAISKMIDVTFPEELITNKVEVKDIDGEEVRDTRICIDEDKLNKCKLLRIVNASENKFKCESCGNVNEIEGPIFVTKIIDTIDGVKFDECSKEFIFYARPQKCSCGTYHFLSLSNQNSLARMTNTFLNKVMENMGGKFEVNLPVSCTNIEVSTKGLDRLLNLDDIHLVEDIEEDIVETKESQNQEYMIEDYMYEVEQYIAMRSYFRGFVNEKIRPIAEGTMNIDSNESTGNDLVDSIIFKRNRNSFLLPSENLLLKYVSTNSCTEEEKEQVLNFIKEEGYASDSLNDFSKEIENSVIYICSVLGRNYNRLKRNAVNSILEFINNSILGDMLDSQALILSKVLTETKDILSQISNNTADNMKLLRTVSLSLGAPFTLTDDSTDEDVIKFRGKLLKAIDKNLDVRASRLPIVKQIIKERSLMLAFIPISDENIKAENLYSKYLTDSEVITDIINIANYSILLKLAYEIFETFKYKSLPLIVDNSVPATRLYKSLLTSGDAPPAYISTEVFNKFIADIVDKNKSIIDMGGVSNFLGTIVLGRLQIDDFLRLETSVASYLDTGKAFEGDINNREARRGSGLTASLVKDLASKIAAYNSFRGFTFDDSFMYSLSPLKKVNEEYNIASYILELQKLDRVLTEVFNRPYGAVVDYIFGDLKIAIHELVDKYSDYYKMLEELQNSETKYNYQYLALYMMLDSEFTLEELSELSYKEIPSVITNSGYLLKREGRTIEEYLRDISKVDTTGMNFRVPKYVRMMREDRIKLFEVSLIDNLREFTNLNSTHITANKVMFDLLYFLNTSSNYSLNNLFDFNEFDFNRIMNTTSKFTFSSESVDELLELVSCIYFKPLEEKDVTQLIYEVLVDNREGVEDTEAILDMIRNIFTDEDGDLISYEDLRKLVDYAPNNGFIESVIKKLYNILMQ